MGEPNKKQQTYGCLSLVGVIILLTVIVVKCDNNNNSNTQHTDYVSQYLTSDSTHTTSDGDSYSAKNDNAHLDSQSLIYYTKENHVFAFTKDAVKKAEEYASIGDKKAFEQLVSSGMIFITAKNVEVYIVEGGLFYVKIRPKGHTTEFWTVSNAVSKTRN